MFCYLKKSLFLSETFLLALIQSLRFGLLVLIEKHIVKHVDMEQQSHLVSGLMFIVTVLKTASVHAVTSFLMKRSQKGEKRNNRTANVLIIYNVWIIIKLNP